MEDVATPEAWVRNQELVTRFYNERRRAVWEAQPNPGHRQLAAWQDRMHVQSSPKMLTIYTNAGSEHVLHLHGELSKSRSCGPSAETYPLNLGR